MKHLLAIVLSCLFVTANAAEAPSLEALAQEAPFSWEPVQVEVLSSGTLAHSSGPVRGADGKQFGVYNSIWRREADGVWKVVFDKGCDVCDCAVAGEE